MSYTKYTLASAALTSIGANPVVKFASTGTAETVACFYHWQPNVDHWLSIYPWRFATVERMLTRITLPYIPGTPRVPRYLAAPLPYQAVYASPTDMKAIQGVRARNSGVVVEYDRVANRIYTKQDPGAILVTYVYQPPIAIWPGYFVTLIEAALAARLSFALSGKLDLRVDIEKAVETHFRIARNADSRQQTTRKFRLTGRRSIMEARRA